jgi:uncharacterized protein
LPTIEQASAWYPHDDPVHGFDHILRVYRLAERLAAEEGADAEIVLAAALLHDTGNSAAEPAGNPAAHDARPGHQHAAAGFARQVLRAESWPADRIAAVEHCIRAHRFREREEEPATLEAQVLFDADKLDAIGATGVARAVAFAAMRGQPAYSPPSASFLAGGPKEPGEAHSAYHEHVFKLSKIAGRMFTAAGKRLAAGRFERMQAFFDDLVAEMQGRA